MTIGLVVLAAILVALLVAFLWFYVYSRSPAWGDSETRKAMLRMLVVVGPMFGVRYREPHPEIPTVSAPGPDPDPGMEGVVLPPTPNGDRPRRP